MSSPTGRGMSRHRKVAVLSKENSDAWFKQMRDWLEGEGLFWVIETATPDSSAETILQGSTPDAEKASLEDPPPGVTSSLPTFRRLDAKTRYTIRLSLNEFDLERVEEAKTAREIWLSLQKKYKAKLPSAGRQYLEEYVTYKMDSSTTIERAWEELSKLGRKVVEQDPSLKALNSTNQRLARLPSALPAEYSSYRATLDARRDVDTEEALEILMEAEHSIHPEMGMFAKRPTSGHKPQRPRSPLQKEGQDCYLCRGHGHYLKSCPYTKVAVQAASEKRKAETSSRRSSDKVESKISQLEKTIDSLQKKLKEVESRQKSKKAYVAGTVESESSSDEGKHQSEEECQEETATFCKENVSTTSADT
ncbi:hypothetical protein EKO04_002366 [Ascochyta lentis]|uniref:CCHC-type domain-containing protein n=1 Tax=Ascochyta lentis TaxID=205686 RepID=A0A8H7JBM0_9PLEO|nr:hypothetical protein EKO04_002366 [Ascochyta lentis]